MAHFAVTEDRLPSRHRLRRALDGLHPDAPVVIMLHGLKYDPGEPVNDPHRHIFALNPDPGHKRAVSWPRRLGLRGPHALALGYGWRARGSIWRAHRRAGQTAAPLTRLIARIAALDPDRPIHIIAHSLGARVALRALDGLPAHTVHRVILIAAAAFESELRHALATPAGSTAEIINIRSRANWIFDVMLRLALPHWGATLGRGRLRRPNLLDLAIDDRTTAARLAAAGYALPEVAPRICHWSAYLRRDACALYRALLHRPGATPLPYLRRLLNQPASRPALPFWPRLPFWEGQRPEERP